MQMRDLFSSKIMTDKFTVATVASEAVRSIRKMDALLKDYSGTALVHLYELQETETIRLIVGAQPLIPPMPDGLLKFKTLGIKEYKKFFFASVLAAWWFTRTVAVFDKEMVASGNGSSRFANQRVTVCEIFGKSRTYSV